MAALHGIPPQMILDADAADQLLVDMLVEEASRLAREREAERAAAIGLAVAHAIFGGRDG